MQLALVGLSHKTAPVEIRERLAFSNDALRSALASLVDRRAVNEAMILSTCNRVEVVAESPDDRLIRDFKYDEESATDVLNYVASIFARGDAKQ